jgi:hypothetical protein
MFVLGFSCGGEEASVRERSGRGVLKLEDVLLHRVQVVLLLHVMSWKVGMCLQ